MNIFNNRKPSKLLDKTVAPEPIEKNAVLDYMVDLEEDDFSNLVKVANIYRKANKDASKVLGVAEEQETPTEPAEDGGTFLDDDIESAFLDDEEPKTKTPTKPVSPVQP